MNLPLEGKEGPVGLILCPSRELARQTYEVVDYYLQALRNAGYPELRSALCIGGEDNKVSHIYIHTYIRTYIHTYLLCIHTVRDTSTLKVVRISFKYTYIHTYIHTQHAYTTYIHTNTRFKSIHTYHSFSKIRCRRLNLSMYKYTYVCIFSLVWCVCM